MRDVRLQRRGERPPEQNDSILTSLALVDPDLAVLKVHVGDLHVAQFADTNTGEEQKTQHQCALHIVRSIHELIEASELIGSKDTWQLLERFVGPS